MFLNTDQSLDGGVTETQYRVRYWDVQRHRVWRQALLSGGVAGISLPAGSDIRIDVRSRPREGRVMAAAAEALPAEHTGFQGAASAFGNVLVLTLSYRQRLPV